MPAASDYERLREQADHWSRRALRAERELHVALTRLEEVRDQRDRARDTAVRLSQEILAATDFGVDDAAMGVRVGSGPGR